MPHNLPCKMEFHISKSAREYYQFDQQLFSITGNVIFADFHATRQFAQKMNAKRDLLRYPDQSVDAGQINAMGLIDEILHMVIARYRQQRNPNVMEKALAWLEDQVGAHELEDALLKFAHQFPPLAVYRLELTVDEYISSNSILSNGSKVSNRQLLLEELIMLWLANMNPAFEPFVELFDDTELSERSAYLPIMASLYGFFETQPTFGPQGQNLIDMLRSPALNSPNSLGGQLEFIRLQWWKVLGDYIQRLLRSLDFIKEEGKPFFGFGPGPALVYEFESLVGEPERFSLDRDWMPNLVLMAKNSYVWLDQLSKKYQRQITRLDQIPDEVLDQLARWGFTGLWLIGLWERSPASRNIKQMRGNPEAVASAYSLFSYDIAADLGGDSAFENLRDRAWQRGIRLASDMVPNHVGIDSRWVIEHPQWFISLDYSPFPAYTFNGPNLSWDDRTGIYLEDHYYDNSDAAVVFKRVDFWTGDTKYIYHGNDGTSMPWNDTAQLNYLMPEVREAVIQTILEVARRFRVIRFDAAMTLAKRHYHRLWFPEPGSGGDIPSRAEYGMTHKEFNQAFPEEFWREVVDRVALEVPGTLLLAEAFWMMEGYFVRSLGMHRVYNSAFMNMLRDEKNQEYRLVIKNTIEFDPEILKRYVNFMNNPDERTAVDQFGKGDKYFGISTLMATMPGLPMFGHGQVEGFTEKYGMEYKRAYWDEIPDEELIKRHEREIFPLLRRRYLFANAQDFRLYDLYLSNGAVNEDVFVFSNRAGAESSLVIYHNKFASTSGWIRLSSAYPVKTGDGDERRFLQNTIAEGLGLESGGLFFTIFRDQISRLEYIRQNDELHRHGLYIELDAYKYHVFLDFQQVVDDESGQYARLAQSLGGRGAKSINDALKEMQLAPLLMPFRDLVNPEMLTILINNRWTPETYKDPDFDQAELELVLDEFESKSTTLLEAIHTDVGGEGDPSAIASEMISDLRVILSLQVITERFPELTLGENLTAVAFLERGFLAEEAGDRDNTLVWSTLLAWTIVRRLGKVYSDDEFAERSRTWIDEWLLSKIITETLEALGATPDEAHQHVALVRLFTTVPGLYIPDMAEDELHVSTVLQNWLGDQDVIRYLYVHTYQDVLWFNKEAFESLCWWAFVMSTVRAHKAASGSSLEDKTVCENLLACYRVVETLLAAADESDYQVDELIKLINGE